jgi:AraC-like DNA-binding protein
MPASQVWALAPYGDHCSTMSFPESDTPLWNPEFFAGLGSVSDLSPLLDVLPGVYFFAKNLAGEFVAVNRPLLEALGMSDAGEILWKTEHAFFDPDLSVAIQAEDAQVKKSLSPLLNQPWLVPNVKTGVRRWYACSKVPLFGKRRQLVGLAGIMRLLEETGELNTDQSRMTAVAAYIRRNVRRPMTVTELASVARFSTRQFQRVFRRIYHIAPMEMVIRERCALAAQMLRDTGNLSLAGIAVDCGFHDHSHLGHQFRRIVGCSPGEYRRAYGVQE